MSTHTPQIGLEDSDRQAVAQVLARVLANTYLLYTKTLVSHWNVEGPNFQSLHLMFETQYQELATAIDEIAERLRVLGEKTPHSYAKLLEHATLQEYTSDLDAEGLVAALTDDHEQLARELREGITTCEEHGDNGDADLLSARLQVHEKTAWMLRSSLSA